MTYRNITLLEDHPSDVALMLMGDRLLGHKLRQARGAGTLACRVETSGVRTRAGRLDPLLRTATQASAGPARIRKPEVPTRQTESLRHDCLDRFYDLVVLTGFEHFTIAVEQLGRYWPIMYEPPPPIQEAPL